MTEHHTTAEWKEIALKVIIEKTLFFIEDVATFMGISKVCFYEHKLNEDNEIKQAILDNKIKAKQGLKQKWYTSEAPVLQVALYKLIGSEDEYHRLANTSVKTDITTNGESLNQENISIDQINEKLDKINELINLPKK